MATVVPVLSTTTNTTITISTAINDSSTTGGRQFKTTKSQISVSLKHTTATQNGTSTIATETTTINIDTDKTSNLLLLNVFGALDRFEKSFISNLYNISHKIDVLDKRLQAIRAKQDKLETFVEDYAFGGPLDWDNREAMTALPETATISDTTASDRKISASSITSAMATDILLSHVLGKFHRIQTDVITGLTNITDKTAVTARNLRVVDSFQNELYDDVHAFVLDDDDSSVEFYPEMEIEE